MAKKLSKSDIHNIVKTQIAESVTLNRDELAYDRARLNHYYNGTPYAKTRAPSKPMRSSVVSRDVFQAVETAMPGLIRVFCSGDSPGEFVPISMDDQNSATEAGEYVNWIYTEKNPGYLNTVEWIKTGVINKFGVAKAWFDDTPKITIERFEGISEEEYQALAADPEFEFLTVEIYPDPEAQKAQEGATTTGVVAASSSLLPALPAAAAGGGVPPMPPGIPSMPPGIAPQPGLVPPGSNSGEPITLEMPPVPNKYDIRAKRTVNYGCIRVAIIAPERFLFPRMATGLDDCPALTHQEPTRVSDLIGQGYDRDALMKLPAASTAEVDPDRRARFDALERYGDDSEAPDDASKEVFLNETYIRIDADKDGYAEYLCVKTAGDQGEVLLDVAEIDDHPFVLWSPVIQPHRMIGSGVADQVDDIQEVKTAIIRGTLDSFYNSNNSTLVIDSTVNERDVLNRVPGGVIRSDGQGTQGVRVLEQVPIVAPSLQMLDHIDATAEQRTGLTRFAMQGIDPNEPANRTAKGVNQLSQAGRDRVELIARNFAEMALKPLFKKLLKLVKRHQNKPYSFKSNGKWINGDPTIWRNDYEFTVTVGLGTGDREVEKQNMFALLAVAKDVVSMQQGIQGPFITADNIHAMLRKLAVTMGEKNPDAYFSNPAHFPREPVAPGQPQPDPVTAALVAKAQADVQMETVKARHKMDLDRQQLEHEMALATQKIQLEAQLEIVKLRVKNQLEAMKQNREMQMDEARFYRETQREAVKDAREIAATETIGS